MAPEEKLNFSQKIRAKLARWRKTVIPLYRVIFRKSLLGKSTNNVIAEVKMNRKNYFSAQVCTLPQLINKINSASDKELKKDELREFLETLPLLLMNIVQTKEKWCVGKIDENQFDIFLAPERLLEINKGGLNIYSAVYVQTKRLYLYPTRRMSLVEWVDFIGKIFKKKIANIDFGFNGHVHFYNCIPLNESVDPGKLKILFKKLYIPDNKHVHSVSISMEIVSSTGETTIMTWYIYPFVLAYVGIFALDLEKVMRMYSETDILKMSNQNLMSRVMKAIK
jgi:hypothetical protein